MKWEHSFGIAGLLAVLSTSCASEVDLTGTGDGAPSTNEVSSQLATTASITRESAAESARPVAKRLNYLQRFYEHFAAGRGAAAAAMLPSALTWSHTGYRADVIPFAGDYTGERAHLEYFRDYFGALCVRQYQFQYELKTDSHVSWHFRLVAFVPATGKTFDAEFIHVWTFDDNDRPLSVRAYYDTQVELQAFTAGGATLVSDLKNPNDDYRVLPTAYDVDSLVRTVYDHFYAGDIPTVLSMLADDAAIYFKGQDFPFAGTYVGKPELLQFVYNLAGTALPYDIQRYQITEGDRTDVVLYENWQVFATNKAFHCHTINSWRVNEQGLLMGFGNAPDTDAVAQAYAP
jgi:ketosteroid isomerase-like protein